MLRIILLIFLFIVSCSLKVIPEERVTLRVLNADVETGYTGKPVKLGEIELSEMLATERILYKEKNRFGYFAKNKWVCTPDCMLERLLLKNFNYLRDDGESELRLEILDLYADFSGEIPRVILTVKAELKRGSEIKTKLFHIERESEYSEEGLFKTFNEVVEEFLKKLDEWINKVSLAPGEERYLNIIFSIKECV